MQANKANTGHGARELSFGEAINEALGQALELDNPSSCMASAPTARVAYFGSTTGLVDRFGAKRVFDTPIAEQA